MKSCRLCVFNDRRAACLRQLDTAISGINNKKDKQTSRRVVWWQSLRKQLEVAVNGGFICLFTVVDAYSSIPLRGQGDHCFSFILLCTLLPQYFYSQILSNITLFCFFFLIPCHLSPLYLFCYCPLDWRSLMGGL